MNEKGFLFLSYRSSEAEFALRLAVDLKNAGVDIWMDRLVLRPGNDFPSKIQKAVDRCVGLMAVLSPAYVASDYCQKELSRAARTKRKIVPILLQEVSPEEYPIELERTQYIDFRNWRDAATYDAKVQELIDHLRTEFVDTVESAPNPEAQFLNCLIADLEARKGILEQLDPFDDEAAKTHRDSIRPVGFMEHWSVETPFDVVGDENDAWLDEDAPLQGIGAVFQRYPRFVIVGAPGAGKTMTLVSLALTAAHERQEKPVDSQLPFFIKLATWRDDETLEGFFQRHWGLNDDVTARMAHGEVIAFCDGLNEISGRAADKVAQLRAWLQGAHAPRRAVFTCRADQYYGAFQLGLPAVQAHSLDVERIRSYVIASLGEVSGNALLRRILPVPGHTSDESRQLFRLARNPFYLNTLVLVQGSSPHGELPRNMGTLANRLIDALWERSRSQGIADTVTFEALAAGLQKLAYAMVSGATLVYAPVGVATQHLGSMEALQAAISAAMLERDNGCVRFHHQLVQDYFAAQEVARIGVEAHLSPPRYDHNGLRIVGKWDRVIISLAGCTDDPDALVSKVLHVDPELAAACLTSGITFSDQTRADAIVTLTNKVVVEGWSIHAAAQSLAGFAVDAAMPMLLGAMRAGTWADRREAALTLRALELPIYRPLARALDHTSPSNTEAIGAHVRKMGERALITLLPMLRHVRGNARRNAAWALGVLGDVAAVPDLVEALTDRDKFVASEAAEALGMIGDAAAVEPLYALAREQTALGKHTRLGKSAISALAHLGEPALHRLVALMGPDSSSEGRRLAANMWKDVDAVPAVPDLLVLSYDENPDVRVAALEALAAVTEDVKAVKRLIEALMDSTFVKRLRRRINDFAAEKLVESGSPQAVRAAERWRAEQERRNRVRSTAEIGKERLHGVSRQNGHAELPAPQHKLPEPAVPTALAEADHASGGRVSSIGQLMAMLDNPDERVRLGAVQTLTTMQGDAAISALVKALGDFEAVVSDAAVDALVMHGAAVITAMRNAIKDDNLNRRAGALEVLCRIPAEAAIPELTAALNDIRRPWLSDRRICDLAAGALERIGTPEAMQAVAKWRSENAPLPTVTMTFTASGATTTPAPSADLADAPPPPKPADDPSRYPEILREMLESLRTEDWGTREETAKDLREFVRIKLHGAHDPAIIDPLTGTLTDPDWLMRWAVVEALAWVGDPGVVPLLLLRLEDENWMVRVAAVRAITEIGDRGAASRLAELLEDPNSTVREAAAEALGKLGDQAAIPALTLAALEREALVRYAAVEALQSIGGEGVIAPIANALHDEEPLIRFRAVVALDELGDSRAVPDLKRMLEDEAVPQWQERRICDIAAEALIHLGTTDAMRAIDTWQSRQTIVSVSNTPPS